MSKLAEMYGAKAQVPTAPIISDTEQEVTVTESKVEVFNNIKTQKIGVVELPVLEVNEPNDLKYIPESAEYIDNKRLLETIAHGIQQNVPVLLIGETGVGKTSAIRYIASKCNVPLRRLNLNGSTTVDEFVGKVMLDKDGTYWVDGILIDAMRRGHWLVVDEINAALPEILFVLQSLLDDDRYVVLAESDGEVVRPHANFRLFATMNPSDGGYTGTKELNKALLSRFSIVLNVEWPTAAEEKKIVDKRYPNRKIVTKEKLATMVKFANDMRGAYAKGSQDFVLSPRDLLSWVHMSEVLGDIMTSAEVTLVNKARKEERASINDLLKLHFGMALYDYAHGATQQNTYQVGDKVVLFKARSGNGTTVEERTNIYLLEVEEVRNVTDNSGTTVPEEVRYKCKMLATNVTLADGEQDFNPREKKIDPKLYKMFTAKYHGDNF
jgi:cobaltochelatase CobS